MRIPLVACRTRHSSRGDWKPGAIDPRICQNFLAGLPGEPGENSHFWVLCPDSVEEDCNGSPTARRRGNFSQAVVTVWRIGAEKC